MDKNRAGKYKTNLSGVSSYDSFLPSLLPIEPSIELTDEITNALLNATIKLTELETLSSHIPNMSLFISMYVRKEALLSSQIEGTQATLEDILDAMIEENINNDVNDVINYIKATNYALTRLSTLPLCNRLIKETHAVLMENIRGSEKNPGEFRTSQNWIGGSGSTLKNAKYIPPSPEDMLECMSNLEKYINYNTDLPVLIQAGLIHYQFETIHPFLDGNGRIGRLLITLFLMDRKTISTPSLYISYYLKTNRIEYYDRMSEVRKSGNYEQWILFFLNAINYSAENAVETIIKLSNLHKKNNNLIIDSFKSTKNALKLFNYIEESPIIDIKKTSLALNLSFNTTSSIIKTFESINILKQTNNKSRNRTFIYNEYVEILKDGTN